MDPCKRQVDTEVNMLVIGGLGDFFKVIFLLLSLTLQKVIDLVEMNVLVVHSS